MIRFGVIGCGGIAKWHVSAIRAIEGASVAAVCDEQPGRAEEFGRESGAAHFSDPARMFESGLVEAVCICTPSGLHAELCIKAVESGLHVVVEKPLAITRKSLEDVLEAEKRCGTKLAVISQMRYADDVKRVKKLLGEGRLGRINMVDLSMKYYREPSYFSGSNWRGTFAMDGGGALMNQGIHGLDLLRFICGDVLKVQCFSRTLLHPVEVEDTLSANFVLSGGGLGVLTATTSCYPGQTRRLEICGDKGSLALTEGSLTYMHLKDGDVFNADRSEGSHGASDPFAIGFELHQRQYEDFLSCITNDTKPAVGVNEAAGTLEIAFALYESAAAGGSVETVKKA